MHTAPKSLPGVSPVITAAPVKLDYCNLLRQIAANRNKRDNRRERERERERRQNVSTVDRSRLLNEMEEMTGILSAVCVIGGP